MSKKVMRRAELRDKNPAALAEELNALRREHFNLRMQKAAQQSTKTSELRRVRRDIARTQTILRQQHQASS